MWEVALPGLGWENELFTLGCWQDVGVITRQFKIGK